MRVRRRFGALAAAVALTVGLIAGCGGGDGPTAENVVPSEAPPAAAPVEPDSPGSIAIAEALTAAREGRIDEAVAKFAGIGPNQPQFTVALSYLARLNEQRGAFGEMLAALETLAPIEPDNANIRYGISRAYFYLGRPAEAELAALRSIEIDADQVPVRYHLGLVRLELGDTQGAINTYLRAMRMPGAAGGAEAAQQALANHLTERPDLAGAYYALALFGRSLGRPVEERRNLERFLELESEGPFAERARENLARLQ